MDAIEALRTRRSVRKFLDKPIPRALLDEVIADAAFAPSWKNSQTARYTIVDDAAVKQDIAEKGVGGFAKNTANISGCAALVVLSTVTGRSGYNPDGSFTTAKGTHWESFDAGIAAQTFCLAAHIRGLGSVILGIYDPDKVAEIIRLPEGESVSALIAVGWPDGDPAAPKRKELDELRRYI
jgi:nitroreductase